MSNFNREQIKNDCGIGLKLWKTRQIVLDTGREVGLQAAFEIGPDQVDQYRPPIWPRTGEEVFEPGLLALLPGSFKGLQKPLAAIEGGQRTDLSKRWISWHGTPYYPLPRNHSQAGRPA